MLQEYRQQARSLTTIEHRLEKLKDRGATPQELMLLREGLQIADELQDEQQAALASIERGADSEALSCSTASIMNRSWTGYRHRSITSALCWKAGPPAPLRKPRKNRTRRTLSEIMVALTALMFLFVLGFILQRRVLYPVVRLSDVVQRLASQDYAVEAPQFTQIDEIGDMAQAIRIFREMASRVSVLNKSAMPTGRFGNCWRA